MRKSSSFSKETRRKETRNPNITSNIYITFRLRDKYYYIQAHREADRSQSAEFLLKEKKNPKRTQRQKDMRESSYSVRRQFFNENLHITYIDNSYYIHR